MGFEHIKKMKQVWQDIAVRKLIKNIIKIIDNIIVYLWSGTSIWDWLGVKWWSYECTRVNLVVKSNLYAAQEYNVFQAVYMAVRCQMGRKYNLFLAQTQCILKHFLRKN